MASYYTLDYRRDNVFSYDKERKLYVAGSDTYAVIRDENHMHIRFDLYEGYMCNGGSVPKVFSWFMPGWDWHNTLLNLAYSIHDYCYGSKCVAKEVADDILRGMLRDAGYNRVHASTVCWAVNNFAKNHYGTDEYNVKEFGNITIY